jgi:uncharacterized RDD family membrane protein YckC
MPANDLPTPKEQAPGLAKRLAALLYDSFLMIALWMVLYWPFYALIENEQLRNFLFNGAFILAVFGYYSRSWRVSGQSLGMQAWRIKLVSTDHQPVSYRQCLIRFMAATGSLVCLAGYFWMLFDKDKLTWHDRFSGTRLVKVPKNKPSKT